MKRIAAQGIDLLSTLLLAQVVKRRGIGYWLFKGLGILVALYFGISLFLPALHTAHWPDGQQSSSGIVKAAAPLTLLSGGHQTQLGAGGIEAQPLAGNRAPNPCTNPLDPACWAQLTAQAIAKWVAQSILSVLQPITDSINKNAVNIVTQTPLLNSASMNSPLNSSLVTLWNWGVGVADAAFAIFIIVGGYSLMVRRQTLEVVDIGLRLLVAVVAAHFSLQFMQIFIEIENDLCISIIHLASLVSLTNLITAILQGNGSTANLLVFILALILSTLMFLLVWQMLVRAALLGFTIVLAGPACLCLANGATLDWFRLWGGLFMGTLLVQFFQVVILALGSILVSTLGTNNTFGIDHTILALLAALAVFSLTLQIPGLMRQWAIRPLIQSATSTLEGIQGRARFLANLASVVALRGV